MKSLANLFCLPLDIAFYAMTSLQEKILKQEYIIFLEGLALSNSHLLCCGSDLALPS